MLTASPAQPSPADRAAAYCAAAFAGRRENRPRKHERKSVHELAANNGVNVGEGFEADGLPVCGRAEVGRKGVVVAQNREVYADMRDVVRHKIERQVYFELVASGGAAVS